MSDKASRKALIDSAKLLEWLLDLYHGTGDRTEKYAYGRVEQKIESGAFLYTESDGEKISSLLTTIESLQTQNLVAQLANGSRIETLGNLVEDQRRLIESQKEEIGRLMAVNQHLEIDLVESKAITELAVKGLKRIRMVSEISPVKTYQRMEVIADTTLSEIERLSHDPMPL